MIYEIVETYASTCCDTMLSQGLHTCHDRRCFLATARFFTVMCGIISSPHPDPRLYRLNISSPDSSLSVRPLPAWLSCLVDCHGAWHVGKCVKTLSEDREAPNSVAGIERTEQQGRIRHCSGLEVCKPPRGAEAGAPWRCITAFYLIKHIYESPKARAAARTQGAK